MRRIRLQEVAAVFLNARYACAELAALVAVGPFVEAQLDLHVSERVFSVDSSLEGFAAVETRGARAEIDRLSHLMSSPQPELEGL